MYRNRTNFFGRNLHRSARNDVLALTLSLAFFLLPAGHWPFVLAMFEIHPLFVLQNESSKTEKRHSDKCAAALRICSRRLPALLAVGHLFS